MLVKISETQTEDCIEQFRTFFLYPSVTRLSNTFIVSLDSMFCAIYFITQTRISLPNIVCGTNMPGGMK